MQETLEELITRLVKYLDSEKFDERVVSYYDYKSKYVVLKPSVTVEISLTEGKVVKIDVSDYFKEVVK